MYEREDLPDEEDAPQGAEPTALCFTTAAAPGNPAPHAPREIAASAFESQFQGFLARPTVPLAESVIACIRDLIASDNDRGRGKHIDVLVNGPQLFHIKNAYGLEAGIIRKLKQPEIGFEEAHTMTLNDDFCKEMLGIATTADGDTPVGSMVLQINGHTREFKELCDARKAAFTSNLGWLFEPQCLALLLGLAFVSRCQLVLFFFDVSSLVVTFFLCRPLPQLVDPANNEAFYLLRAMSKVYFFAVTAFGRKFLRVNH